MKPMTVNDLYKDCATEILNGNGERVIMISDDDEGNGYHYLWYSFQTVTDYDNETKEVGLPDTYLFNYNNEEVSKKEDTIILG